MRKWWNGVVGDHSGARLAQITDGAAHTLLAGEKWVLEQYYTTVSIDAAADNQTNLIAADNPGDNGSMYLGYDYDNVRATNGEIDSRGSRVGALPRRDSEYDRSHGQQDKRGAHYNDCFGGPHPGGVNTVRCDGSVHAVSFDIDPDVWRSLGNRADGEINR